MLTVKQGGSIQARKISVAPDNALADANDPIRMSHTDNILSRREPSDKGQKMAESVATMQAISIKKDLNTMPGSQREDALELQSGNFK